MSTFDAAIGPLLHNEGGKLVPEDNGRGASKWGVTLASYREFYPRATTADIAALGPEQATAFYRMAFWARYHLGLIDDQELATKALDLAVNDGGGTLVKLLQRAAGAHDDGVLGPATAAAVNALPPQSVLAELRAVAAEHYRAIVAAHPERASQLPGWLARLAK